LIFKKTKSVAHLDSKYLDLCINAASDASIFNNFRNLPDYKNILEHVDRDLAVKYYKNIQKNFHLSDQEIFRICNKLSRVGKPELVEIVNNQNPISTTSLRYLNVALQIKNEFKQKSFAKVIEIGPGYGGQSIILEEFFKIDHYTFIDLPEVNNLIDMFIKANDVNFTHDTGILEDSFSDKRFDLIISNYAFSELNRKLQKKAIKDIINNSKFCFMINNSKSFMKDSKYKSLKFMSQKELLKNINNSYIKKEEPLTAEGNYLFLAKN
tara:strand:- start:2575 stop:3375 length:801 start_codon:yes stop_codon:yes gene_type:complete